MATATRLELEGLEGFCYSGKQMLVLSLDDIEDDPILKLEMEPHYAYSNLYFLTHKEIPLVEINSVVNDFDFCYRIGFSLFSLSLIPNFSPQSALISIQDYNGVSGFRIDGEKYVYEGRRKFIKNIALPSMHEDEIYDNDRLLQAVGKTIVETLLPLEGQWPPLKK